MQGERLIPQDCNRYQWTLDNNLKTDWDVNASGKKALIQNQRRRKIQFQFCSEWQKRQFWKTQRPGEHRGEWWCSTRENRVIHDEIKCYACQTLVNYTNQCPGQTGTDFYQTGIMFSQGKHKIKYTWLFLDTCSSNRVSNNPRMVKNV